VDALELIVLGRRLAKIGERVMRGSSDRALPTGVGLVLEDVFAHPDSSVGEITARVGLPQSYVSESIARLRDREMIQTTADEVDARRTLVRVHPDHPQEVVRRGAVSIDEALADALGEANAIAVIEEIDLLESIAARLRETSNSSGPVGQLDHAPRRRASK
jgi:DNA-binding MarR family transcriptional regulator